MCIRARFRLSPRGFAPRLMSQRLTDRTEHCLIVERLFDKLGDAGLHRLNRERNVGVALSLIHI